MGNPQFAIALPSDVKKKIDEWYGNLKHTIVNHWERDHETHLVNVLCNNKISSYRLFRIAGKMEISQDNSYTINVDMIQDKEDKHFEIVLS